MPRGVKKAVEPEVTEPKATKAVEPGAFDVIDSTGNIKRTFTIESHGDQAGELATSFAKKFGLKVK
jgi:hypothetical protein